MKDGTRYDAATLFTDETEDESAKDRPETPPPLWDKRACHRVDPVENVKPTEKKRSDKYTPTLLYTIESPRALEDLVQARLDVTTVHNLLTEADKEKIINKTGNGAANPREKSLPNT